MNQDQGFRTQPTAILGFACAVKRATTKRVGILGGGRPSGYHVDRRKGCYIGKRCGSLYMMIELVYALVALNKAMKSMDMFVILCRCIENTIVSTCYGCFG